MPDNVFALVHGDDRAFALPVLPRDDPMVGHLASPTGEKYGGIKRYLIAFDCDNFCAAFKCVTVFVIEQFRLHGVRSFAYIFSLKKPLVQQRDERNSRGTTLISHGTGIKAWEHGSLSFCFHLYGL